MLIYLCKNIHIYKYIYIFKYIYINTVYLQIKLEYPYYIDMFMICICEKEKLDTSNI